MKVGVGRIEVRGHTYLVDSAHDGVYCAVRDDRDGNVGQLADGGGELVPLKARGGLAHDHVVPALAGCCSQKVFNLRAVGGGERVRVRGGKKRGEKKGEKRGREGEKGRTM